MFAEATKVAEQKNSSPSRQGNRNSFFQPKLTINQPGDEYEREADEMAEQVMRMPAGNNPFFQPKPISSIQRKCAECEKEEKEKVQRKPADVTVQRQEPGDLTFPELKLHASSLFEPKAGPDYLSLKQPFLNRGIPHLWDADSALGIWNFNFNFFKKFGLSDGLSTSLTNFTAPRFIDSQLKAGNPTWWEITDRDLKTTSYVGSIPILDFNADFSPTAPAWYKTLFKGGGSSAQRKESSNKIPEVTHEVGAYIGSLSSKGLPLSESTRKFFEPRLGYDLSEVKIHNDDAASKSAQSINALAYTSGNNIVFSQNQFSPETNSGKKLLAHELTHVVQQRSGISRQPFVRNRPDWASIPIDYEMIPDPVERMELMRADYERWRWKDALERLKNGELDDNDLKYESLRRRLTGLKTSEVTDLITKIKAYQAQRDKDIQDKTVTNPQKKIPITTDKIVEWLEVRKVISTPMPENAVVKSLVQGMIDSYSISIGDIDITVMPDTFGNQGNETGPTTNFTGNFTWVSKSGIMTELKKNGVAFNPTKLEVTIVTKYKGKPDEQSAYGKGTTESDKFYGSTTLRAHEGQHGTDFINYLAKTPLPVSLKAGVVGKLTPNQFKQIINYAKDISKDSCDITDQVGFTQNEFLKTPEGKASGIVSCKP